VIRRYEPAFLLLWSMIAAALAFGDVEHPIRSALVLGFLAFVPGWALVRLLGFEDYMSRLLLALPTSLGLAAVVSAALVYAGLTSWDLALSVLIAVAVGAVSLDLAHPRILAPRASRSSKRKLDDENRQAALIRTLMDGGTLIEAADAAGVSMATLQRALRSSDQLRLAASVASRGQLDAHVEAPDDRIEAAHPESRATGT
jgi:hypothetical protein